MFRLDSMFTEADLAELWTSTIGIERETTRIRHDGQLASTPHSDQWGNRSFHPYIQTDFGESQLEFITPPSHSSGELMGWLKAIHQIAATTIERNQEWLWPLSTPESIPLDGKIAVAQLEDKKEVHYREYLASHYGNAVQLLSGIHYNFQINPQVIQAKIEAADQLIAVTNKIYTKLGRNFLRYRWILTYLLGASPFVPENYATHLFGTPQSQPMRSVRQSRYGYKNEDSLHIRYDSLVHFVEDLEAAIAQNQLTLEKELYADVRFRRAPHARDLLTKGIQYIEFRSFDLNPYSPYGISQEDIDFIRLFLIGLLYLEDVRDQGQVDLGNQIHREISEAHPLAPHHREEEVADFFALLSNLAQVLDNQIGTAMLAMVRNKAFQMAHPEETLGGRLLREAPDFPAFQAFGLQQAQKFQALYLENPFLLHGWEGLEISTQDLVKEAIRLGLEVTVLDWGENFLQLSYGNHHELIRKANMTARDSLISYYTMENKVVTKSILSQAGIHTPRSKTYHDIQSAKHAFPYWSQSAFVVKPKSTNYGLGITIFEQPPREAAFLEALHLAFQEDHDVLIEAFVPGTEYRFYVQGQEVKAICERVAAHIIGDGVHTIRQLIEEENTHPLRGPQHLAPMTFLETGEAETMQLSHQGLDFDVIPAKGHRVFLRKNSNISTGGISIDRTDQVHPSFKDLAVRCSQALGAYFCGVDILIEDSSQSVNNTAYGVIEANFNPAMWIHRFVGQGQPRYLAFELIKDLFSELPLTLPLTTPL